MKDASEVSKKEETKKEEKEPQDSFYELKKNFVLLEKAAIDKDF